MLDCLAANFPYSKLDKFARMQDFKFLLFIRSSILPVRVGAELLLEPYYPNWFARQFAFNQGVPSNRLSIIRALRQQRSILDLVQAHANLLRRDTGSKVYVPSFYYKGVCSWYYCSWWMNKKELFREAVYIIDHLRPLCEFVLGAVEI